ncbi:MAG: enhanced entry protein [uncultured bacterium]|nr:MAG: enhanced entry protein [uncultured bacterium]
MMRRTDSRVVLAVLIFISMNITACATYQAQSPKTMASASSQASLYQPPKVEKPQPNYASRVPQSINSHGQKVIVVDPRAHVWAAYGPDGNLIRAGLATAGAKYCPDIKRACKTRAGTFRVNSLGSKSCKSSIYPLPKGGAPMPYCMFFNGNQGLHGSHYHAVIEGNVSHGCVRMRIQDAEWLRFNFARVGTKVIVKSY